MVDLKLKLMKRIEIRYSEFAYLQQRVLHDLIDILQTAKNLHTAVRPRTNMALCKSVEYLGLHMSIFLKKYIKVKLWSVDLTHFRNSKRWSIVISQ